MKWTDSILIAGIQQSLGGRVCESASVTVDMLTLSDRNPSSGTSLVASGQRRVGGGSCLLSRKGGGHERPVRTLSAPPRRCRFEDQETPAHGGCRGKPDEPATIADLTRHHLPMVRLAQADELDSDCGSDRRHRTVLARSLVRSGTRRV